MQALDFIKSQFIGWGKYERIIFPLEILFIICLSFYIGDGKIALISAVCGILYTVLAGKGKVSCFIFGIIGTFCYSYISFKNAFWGQLALYLLYYLPLYFVGIYKWSKNLNSESTIIKKQLPKKELCIYIILTILSSIILSIILFLLKDKNPIIDSITTICSIIGLLITVKCCIEQWYFWLIVNSLSSIMWFHACLTGADCVVTVIMWATYTVLAVYFWVQWNKEIKNGTTNQARQKYLKLV